MRPVQAAAVGSQTSNLISESYDGVATPCTRHIGTLTVLPLMTVPGATLVAEVIVDASGVTDVRAAQSRAAWLKPGAAAKPSASAAAIAFLLMRSPRVVAPERAPAGTIAARRWR